MPALGLFQEAAPRVVSDSLELANKVRKHMGQLQCDWKVYDAVPQEQILEIIFCGVHEWTHGREMQRHVEKILAEHEAAGIVLNFLNYEYVFGNDVGASVITAAYDLDSKKPRPACIVATGTTYQSLYQLFKIAKLIEALEIEFLHTVDSGLQRLRSRLGKQ